MNTDEMRHALQEANYEFNELGDGTGALISLDSGKIMTLNVVGAAVIAGLFELEGGGQSKDDFVAQQAAELSLKFDISASEVSVDINGFLDRLMNSLD